MNFKIEKLLAIPSAVVLPDSSGKAPEDWHTPKRWREMRLTRENAQRLGLRQPSAAFARNAFMFLLLALLSFGQNSFAAGEVHFREGVAAYEAGRYEPAAQAFRDSLAEQAASGTLLNLGLAEWRCSRPDAAIVAWEQSAWLNPFNPDVHNNLSYARETLQLNAPELTWCEQASTWLPASFWTWIAGCSLWLAVVMVTVPGFFRMRKAGWHQAVAALAAGIFLLSIPPNLGVFTRAQIGIVMERNTPLRLTPTKSAETTTSLSAGEPVRCLRQRGDYFFVHTQYGNGWIGQKQVKFLCPK